MLEAIIIAMVNYHTTVEQTSAMPSESPASSAKALRQDRLLALLQTSGACTYTEFEKRLGVSSMTVRRDVDELARREALIKTLGGARDAKVPQFLHETAVSSRLGVNRVEKDTIALAACNLVRPHQTIYVDGGTTCIAFARVLAKTPVPFTAITNSALVAMELGVSPTAKVICLGGEYDAQSLCFVGPLAEEAGGKFFVDQAFLSTKAISPADGTYEAAMGTLRVKQVLARHAGVRVLLVDGSKFGQRALCKVLDIDRLDVVVTDATCPKTALRTLRRRGRQVVVARAI